MIRTDGKPTISCPPARPGAGESWRCEGCTQCHPDGGCAQEICPGCFCSKERAQNVCDACHAFNLTYLPYVEKYGLENRRAGT